MKVKVLNCVLLFATVWTVACQAPLPMEFSRQEYQRIPSLGDLLDPGIKPRSPALQTDSLPLSHLGNIQKTKVMAPGPITSWEIDGETGETVSDFIF